MKTISSFQSNSLEFQELLFLNFVCSLGPVTGDCVVTEVMKFIESEGVRNLLPVLIDCGALSRLENCELSTLLNQGATDSEMKGRIVGMAMQWPHEKRSMCRVILLALSEDDTHLTSKYIFPCFLLQLLLLIFVVVLLLLLLRLFLFLFFVVVISLAEGWLKLGSMKNHIFEGLSPISKIKIIYQERRELELILNSRNFQGTHGCGVIAQWVESLRTIQDTLGSIPSCAVQWNISLFMVNERSG